MESEGVAMTSLLVNKDTLTDQIVAKLEHEIVSGKIKPLMRLNNTRQLAQSFGVSQKVVLFALDRLEEKKLIVRKPRVGVFVSEGASEPDVKEILVFVFGDTPKRNPFIQRVCDVIHSDSAKGRYDFFARYVNLTPDQLSDQKYMYRRLDAEIARLSKKMNVSAVLVMGPCFDRSHIKRCLDLPFPLLFVGDFMNGDFSDLKYNRLGMVHNYFDMPTKWVIDRGAKRVVLFSADISSKRRYFQDAVDRMNNIAKKHGVSTDCILVSNTINPEDVTRHAGLIKAVENFKKLGGADAIILDCIHSQKFLVDQLKHSGFEPLTTKLQLISAQNLENVHGMQNMVVDPKSCLKLHEHLCELIEKLTNNQLNCYREEYDLVAKIVE